MSIRPKEQLHRGLERMNLPSEAFGASFIEITGQRQILLLGQKGIRSYSETEIIVELPDCAVQLQGQGLGIVTMTGEELLLRGTLELVRFLR
jgi:sporulation protein YqfC